MKRDIRFFIAIGAIVVIAAFAYVYYYFDPAEAAWMPRCLWKLTTGTDCPGCGSQRMAHALMHGDISGAWGANAYGLCMLPVIVFLIYMEFTRTRHPRLYRVAHSPIAIYLIAISILLWWLIRNL